MLLLHNVSDITCYLKYDIKISITDSRAVFPVFVEGIYLFVSPGISVKYLCY